MKFLSILMLVGMSAGLVVGQIPARDWWGEEVAFVSARSLAAGGVSLHESRPAALFVNPALISVERHFAVEATGILRLRIEQRTRVVYDNFENALGEAAFADNYGSNALAGPLAAAGRLGPVVVAAGARPARDFSYDYLKEYRDDFYVKIGEERVHQLGSLYNVGVGAAARPVSWLGLGAAGGYCFGSRSFESVVIDGRDTATVAESGRPNGVTWHVGALLVPIRRLSIGADLRGGTKLSDWRKADSVVSAEARSYPASAGISASYRAAGDLPSTITLETRYQDWSGVDSGLSPVFSVRVGVEHLLPTMVALRYGFGVEPMAVNPSVHVANVGFGVGFDVGAMRIDLGLGHSRAVIGGNEFYHPLTEDGVKVYENRTTCAVTLSRGF